MSKSYEIQGQIHSIGTTTAYGQNGFTKREFVIKITGPEENSQYASYAALELIKDKCSLMDSFRIGDEIKVQFNISGRLWSGNGGPEKCFTSLQAWKIEALTAATVQDGPPATEFDESRYMPDIPEDSNGDIPF